MLIIAFDRAIEEAALRASIFGLTFFADLAWSHRRLLFDLGLIYHRSGVDDLFSSEAFHNLTDLLALLFPLDFF